MILETIETQEKLFEAALTGRYRIILFGGAIRGSKTMGSFIAFLLAKKKWPGMRCVFARKDMATIERNTYPTWEKLSPQSVKDDKRFSGINPHVKFKNKSELIFFGENYAKDKQLTRWSGLETNWFILDEVNELQEKSFNKAIERAGSYSIPNGKNPHPLIIATCNPTRGWVKERFYDKWKNGTLPDNVLYIPSRIYDNKPFLRENPDYLESLRSLPKYEYEVFVEGNWDIQLKSGGEFLEAFELDKHIKPIERDDKQIHISIDNNLLPYCAISVWQVEGNGKSYKAKQIKELPAIDPDNSAPGAGKIVKKYLESIEYNDTVFVYGDPSTQSKSTINEEKKSFIQLFLEQLKDYRTELRMWKRNISVSNMGAFVNACLSGEVPIEIEIDENCKKSINDYVETKKDINGGILKKRVTDSNTKQSYEENGHFTDTFKDFLCQCFESDFNKFIGKKKKAKIIW